MFGEKLFGLAFGTIDIQDVPAYLVFFYVLQSSYSWLNSIKYINQQSNNRNMATTYFLLFLCLATLGSSLSGVCTGGSDPSPIDITTANAKYCSNQDIFYLEFLCQTLDGYSFVSGTTTGQIVLNTDPPMARVIAYSNFEGESTKFVGVPSKISFIAGSEHKLKSTGYALEMRIIFDAVTDFNAEIDLSQVDQITSYTKQQIKDELALASVEAASYVVSFLFVADSASTDTDFFDTTNKKLNLKNLLDCMTDRFFYRYKGELPEQGGCVTGVQWAVARQPIKISQASIDALKTAGSVTGTPAAVQSLGSRTLRIAGAPCHPNLQA